MADINTSIKIGADASQAITEMQRLQSVTQQVKTTGENINIAPKVDATAIDALKTKIASTAVEVPVTVTPQVQGGVAGISQANLGQISTPMAASLAIEQQAASNLVALQNQIANNQIKSDVDKNASVIAATEVLKSSTDERIRLADRERDAQDGSQLALQSMLKAERELAEARKASAGPSPLIPPDALAAAERRAADAVKLHAAALIEYRDAQVQTLNAKSREAEANTNLVNTRNAAAEAAKREVDAINGKTAALGGLRGGLASALGAYKDFSTGASAGVENLKSLSLNILADIELIKRTATTFYDVGTAIYNNYQQSVAFTKQIEIINIRSVEVQKQFEKQELTAKSNAEAIQELNTKIEESAKRYADAAAQADQLARNNQFVVGGTRKRFLDEAEAAKKQLEAQQLLKSELLKIEEIKSKRMADAASLRTLDEEARIRKSTELDIAALQDQLNGSKDAAQREAFGRMIEYRKAQEQAELKEYTERQKKAAEEEAKRKKDATTKAQDEARAAEIANLTDQAKIEQSYLFDLDKINRRIAEAQTEEEKKALEALAKARKAQRDREMKEYHNAQKKAMDENAAQMKEAARENAEYQKSLMEDLVNYQKQLVASFSGLQGSMFPKEAMTYLRQIAGGTNRLPP